MSWQEGLFAAGLAVAMCYSFFWAFAPASVYARIEGVAKARVPIWGRVLHFVIAASCAFVLAVGAYVRLSPDCDGNACWQLQNLLGPAVGLAIGCGVLIKICNTVLDFRKSS